MAVNKNKCLWSTHRLFGSYSYGFCPHEKAWNKFWTTVNTGVTGIPPYPTSEGRTTYTNPDQTSVINPVALVTINEKEGIEPLQVMALLVHEAVHIKQRILDLAGEDNVGHETEAYLVQTIAQDLFYMYRDTRVL